MKATAARALGFTMALTMSFALSAAAIAEEEFMPWAPATAGLPSVVTSVDKVYVHGIKPSVGMDESIGPPLSAAFVSSVRKAAWAKGREIQSADEIKLSSPNVGSYIEGCTSGPCVVEIARAVGCGVAISATVSKVGSTFLVDAIVVETGKGTVLGRETERVRGRNEASLLDSRGLPKVIKKLLQGLPDLAAPLPAAAVAQATPPPAEPAAPQPPAPAETAPPQTAPPAEEPTPTAEPAQPPEAPGADTPEEEATTEAAAADETSGDEIEIRVEEEGETTDGEGAAPETDVATADPEEEGGIGDVLSVSGYVLVGAGVLIGAVGGIAHLAALNADGEVESQRHAANQVNAIIGQGLFYQNAAFVMYGIGAAGLLLGIAGIGGGACL